MLGFEVSCACIDFGLKGICNNASATFMKSKRASFQIRQLHNCIVLSCFKGFNTVSIFNPEYPTPISNQSEEEGKDQESIQSSTTADPEHHMGKLHKHNKTQHTQERQKVSPSPAGDHKAASNINISITKTNMKHECQKGSTKEAPPWNSQLKLLWDLNMFHITNLFWILMWIKIQHKHVYDKYH